MTIIDFAPLIESLYRELDAARAQIVDVPPGALTVLLSRYDQARLQAQPPIVDNTDPASVSAMFDCLAPLYTAVCEWDRGLQSWTKTHDPEYSGPMVHLAFNPFEGFFRSIFGLVYADPAAADQTLSRILIIGRNPWEVIKELMDFPNRTD